LNRGKNETQKFFPMQNDANLKRILITILRIAIGWHFLYEGVSKLIIGNWSAHSFLANTSGFMSGFYHWLASSPALLKTVDFLNIYGLIVIGLFLFLGLLIRFAALSGTLLLLLYYFAYPPFGSSVFGTEGNLFIVDRLFIEAVALMFIAFGRETGYGIGNLYGYPKKITESAGIPGNSRREALKNLATLPLLGVLGFGALSVKKKYGVDVMSGATIQVNPASLGELKGELPRGKIGGHEISRIIMGGNLIGGWAHARDLIYASSLFRAYNTERKVYETLMLEKMPE
jgi:uncharacterized membrane protein YphA (DoxX/SURF4 family)